MLAEGKIIRDNGKSQKIKDNAITFIKSGPKPLTEDFIRASRYFIYDLLDDFQDSNNHPEAIMTLNTISTQLADFILRRSEERRVGKECRYRLSTYNEIQNIETMSE